VYRCASVYAQCVCARDWTHTKNEHIGDPAVPQGSDEESLKEVNKGVWGMPRLSEAKKDVISCEKLRGSANSC
jgi:hypothetical protein